MSFSFAAATFRFEDLILTGRFSSLSNATINYFNLKYVVKIINWPYPIIIPEKKAYHSDNTHFAQFLILEGSYSHLLTFSKVAPNAAVAKQKAHKGSLLYEQQTWELISFKNLEYI
jgi:hypothetical protein